VGGVIYTRKRFPNKTIQEVTEDQNFEELGLVIMKSFRDLGLSFELLETCDKQLFWYHPMKIQTQVIPLALQG
jgi:superfamily II DNA/RNA helicase